MANKAVTVTVNPYEYAGTFLYGYSDGTFIYGEISDRTCILANGESVRINTIRYYSEDDSGLPQQPTIYVRFDGDGTLSGITSITINGYIYNISSAIWTAAGTGGGGRPADEPFSSWKFAAPVNPFPETAGAEVTVSLNGIGEAYGFQAFNANEQLVIKYTADLVRFVQNGFIGIPYESYTDITVSGMTTDGTWFVMLDSYQVLRDITVTIYDGYFRINNPDPPSGGFEIPISYVNYWVLRI